MKPPDDPVPSGDRTMGRSLIAALKNAGFEPEIASRFRSRDSEGKPNIQNDRITRADIEIRKLVVQSSAKNWRFWLTYHNYYKAPDLIGPAVSRALGIPYVLVEATRARKRFNGPWDIYARAAEAATDAASCIFFLTRHDEEALLKFRTPQQKLVHLKPFLNTNALPTASPPSPKMLSVGMLRAGDKLASYQLIAKTLECLQTIDWHLSIVGDGPEYGTVARMMAPFGGRVSMLGKQDTDKMSEVYRNAGILLWPGVNEAFGMVYLEAQAAGLAVVAQDRPGVRDILAPELLRPNPNAGAPALAKQVDILLNDPEARADASRKARAYVAQSHLLDSASKTIEQSIRECLA